MIVSPNPVKGYRHAFQCFIASSTCLPRQYGVCRWCKQVVWLKLSDFASFIMILYFQACKKNSSLPCWVIYASLFVDLACNGYRRIYLKGTKHVLYNYLSVCQPHYLASRLSSRINCILTGFEIMQIIAFGQNLQMELQW